MHQSCSPCIASVQISPRRKARSTRCEEDTLKLNTPSRSAPKPHTITSKSAPDAPAALAFSSSASRNSDWAAADESVSARRRPDDEAEGTILAHLTDPEHLHKAVPVLVNVKSGKEGDKMLCLYFVRPGAEATQVASLRLAALTMSRYWGTSSTQRMVALEVPGADQVGSIYLKLGSYQCMKRLANMVGREDFE